MTVPLEDLLCRFIHPRDWFPDGNRPAASAFRASKRKLSTWHCNRVVQQNSSLEDLCFDNLGGFGQAILSVRDYIEAAEQTQSPAFRPIAVWRPEEAPAAWDTWRNAHVNVEAEAGHAGFPPTYRQLLANRCEDSKPPLGL